MMKKLLFFTAFMAFSSLVLAQDETGDYRSIVSLDLLEWQDNTSWEQYDGADWQPATDYPAFGGSNITYTVTIQSGSDVIFGLDTPYTINIAGTGQLLVESGGVLSILFSELNIITGASVTIDGELNCEENIDNNGDLIINGALRNFIP